MLLVKTCQGISWSQRLQDIDALGQQWPTGQELRAKFFYCYCKKKKKKVVCSPMLTLSVCLHFCFQIGVPLS